MNWKNLEWGLEMGYTMTPVYTQGYSKHTNNLDGSKIIPQWISPEVYTISKEQDRKCLSNSCLTFYRSGNECIKHIYASTDPET